MLCPKCGRDCAVINSRQKDYGRMRRYECLDCKERFTTIETIDEGFSRGKPSDRIMGYNIRDLFLFAEACRKCGIEENDLKRFSREAESAFDFVVRYEQEMIVNAIKYSVAKTSEDLHFLVDRKGKTK